MSVKPGEVHIALEKEEDIKSMDSLSVDKLYTFFTTDIFGEGFIAPDYELTDLMKVILLNDYFKPIEKNKSDKYIAFVKSLINDPKFKHPCNENKAKKFADLIKEKKKAINFSDKDYTCAIKFVERESLLKGYENGISIMMPISVGSYYTMSVFLTFKTNFMNIEKTCNFWKASLKNNYRSRLIELHNYLNQIPMLMLTKLYSLFFIYKPTVELKPLMKKGLSIMLCIPEESIKKTEPRNNDCIKIKLLTYSKIKKLFLPYPTSFDRKKTFQFFTKAVVNEIIRKLNELHQNIISEQMKLRMKDAVVAIMGRNMSHNIGSHVLANVVNLDELHKEEAQNLFRFLQQRMDFIAQVSTTSPLWTVDIKLKDFIGEFDKQKYLKDYIADFRGLRHDDIKINYEKQTNGDKEIAIPTGGIGCHALYSILENIIRNAARHGMKNGQKKLNLSIKIDDTHPIFYKFTITDNCKNANNADESNKKLPEVLTEKLADHIIDDTGQLKREAWGLKEKKILACYLRLISQEEVDEKYDLYKNRNDTDEEPPIIKTSNNSGNLAYEFFLLKPKKALVVSDKIQGNEEFKKTGIEFIGVNDFGKMDRKRIIHKFLVLDINGISDYQSWINNNILNHINRLPFRILISGDNSSFNNLPKNIIHMRSPFSLNSLTPDQFYEKLWKEWVNHLHGEDYKLTVRISNIAIPENLNKIEDNKDCLPDAKFHVLLDHKSKSDESKLYEYEKVICHIPFDTSGGTIYGLIETAEQKPYLISQLIDMGVTKIAIVDDRIWKEKDKPCNVSKYSRDESKKLSNLWKRQGVEIYNVDEAVQDFAKFVNNDFPDNRYHFLIFHQGEIDEIKKRLNNEQKFDGLWENLKKKVICTVIDTGRGSPEQAIKDNLRWISYSILQNYIIDNAGHSLAKQRLIDLLTSLKAEGNNE